MAKKSKKLLLVGLDAGQQEKVLAQLGQAAFQVTPASSPLDLTIPDHFAAIINREALPPQDTTELTLFFAEIDGGSTGRLFIADDADVLARAANGQTYASLEALLPQLGGTLKKAQDRALRQESLTGSIAVSFFIDAQIRANPGITTATLAHMLKRREVEVKRYIEELQMAGRNIRFDKTAMGWHFVP